MKLKHVLHNRRIYETYRRCISNLTFDIALLNESTDFEGYETTGDLDTDYPIFMKSLLANKVNPASLTVYSLQEYKHKGARLFKLKGINAGFAIAADGDIISVHNSDSAVKGVGPLLMKLAKQEGGTKLDHFDLEPLNKLYGSAGFKEYDRYSWNDDYAPDNWNYEKYGRPDLILRRQ